MPHSDLPVIVSWFSCGTASAVSTKLTLSKSLGRFNVIVARIELDDEHPSNSEFSKRCSEWFQSDVMILRSDEYENCSDVWRRKRYISGTRGAPCTTALKKDVRKKFEAEFQPDMQAFGFTVEERKRAERFRLDHPEMGLVCPLIDAGLTKSDCHSMVTRAGIEIPEMYRLGFNNNNCIGCVKSDSPRYWNRVRRHFPEVFRSRVEISRALGVKLVKLTKGDRQRIFLDDLDPSMDDGDPEPNFDCSMMCVTAETLLSESQGA